MGSWRVECFVRVLATGLMLLLASGCQGQSPTNGEASDMVTELASETHCGAEEPALEWVGSESDVAAVGGKDAERMKQALEEDALVLRVNLGQRPTPGYSAELKDVQSDGDTLILDMKATEPASDAMVSQVITTPCVVLEVPASGWTQLEVRLEAEGFPLTLEHPNPG